MSILARLQRLVRAEFTAVSAVLDDALTNDVRAYPPSLVARPPTDLRRERAQAYDWLAGIEADAAAALQAGDNLRAQALLHHAAYAESVLAGGKSTSESGAWPVASQQSAPVSAPAQTMTLPRNPYGVASPGIRVRQAPPFASYSQHHTEPASRTVEPLPAFTPVAGAAVIAPHAAVSNASDPGQLTARSHPDLYSATDPYPAGDGLYSPAMDALLDRFEQTAARAEAVVALSEVDALLATPAPEDFRVPAPPEPVADSGADPLERLRRNLDPTA